MKLNLPQIRCSWWRDVTVSSFCSVDGGWLIGKIWDWEVKMQSRRNRGRISQSLIHMAKCFEYYSPHYSSAVSLMKCFWVLSNPTLNCLVSYSISVDHQIIKWGTDTFKSILRIRLLNWVDFFIVRITSHFFTVSYSSLSRWKRRYRRQCTQDQKAFLKSQRTIALFEQRL